MASAAHADGLPVTPLAIVVHHHKVLFQVEVARTDAEQERGLMFRDHLGANKGMIFPMMPVRAVAFWMKNTMIPLDIIFIGPDGRIAQISARAQPYSLTPIASGGNVEAVLEVAGGTSARLGLAVGEPVSWPH